VLEFFAQLPPCLIGIEACGSAHYRARELTKLGHTTKLMAAQYVMAYRKRGKNDVNDAEAICEAVGRPNMRFVAIKSEEQQAVLMVHRARALTVANRTAQVNQIRGLLGEFGLVVPRGVGRLRRELPGILEDAENGLPALAREVLAGLLEQLREADRRIGAYDRQIRALAEASEAARRLMRVESIRRPSHLVKHRVPGRSGTAGKRSQIARRSVMSAARRIRLAEFRGRDGGLNRWWFDTVAKA
jgi:transposase